MTCIYVRLLGPCFKTGRRGHRPTRYRYAARSKELWGDHSNPCQTHYSTKSSSNRSYLPLKVSVMVLTVRSVKSWSNAPIDFIDKPKETLQNSIDKTLCSRLKLKIKLRELLRLPLNSFTYNWNLSSKFFSTLHHCTCSLLASGSYLALPEVYLALWAALPSSPFLKAESEPRSWLSSQRTNGSSSSSKTQFFNCSSSSELIGTTFTITNAERLFLRTWNFYKCLKLSQFLGGKLFFEFFYGFSWVLLVYFTF